MKDKERLLAGKIEMLMEMFPVVAVIGPRQCGKSTLVRAVYLDWKYYDLERPDDYQLITSDPLGFFSTTEPSLTRPSSFPTSSYTTHLSGGTYAVLKKTA